MATINGTNNGDSGNGTDLADQIFEFAGNDTLIGFDGDDALEGGKGADQLFGGSGFDTASYRGSNAGVVINLPGFVFAGSDATGDSLFGIEGVVGSAFADILTGDDARNVLHGEGGTDILDGSGGNDTLTGGAGDDLFVGGTGADTAIHCSESSVVVDLASGTAIGGEIGGRQEKGEPQATNCAQWRDRSAPSALAQPRIHNSRGDSSWIHPSISTP
jgi:Ca2+-binding RTX toxin-like protein